MNQLPRFWRYIFAVVVLLALFAVEVLLPRTLHFDGDIAGAVIGAVAGVIAALVAVFVADFAARRRIEDAERHDLRQRAEEAQHIFHAHAAVLGKSVDAFAEQKNGVAVVVLNTDLLEHRLQQSTDEIPRVRSLLRGVPASVLFAANIFWERLAVISFEVGKSRPPAPNARYQVQRICDLGKCIALRLGEIAAGAELDAVHDDMGSDLESLDLRNPWKQESEK